MFLSSFLILFIVLLAAWVLGSLVFHVAGGLIHLLLVVAVIFLDRAFCTGPPIGESHVRPRQAPWGPSRAFPRGLDGACSSRRANLASTHHHRD